MTLFIAATALATLLTCCRSNKVYIDRPHVPELVFPIFPALEDSVRNQDGSVTVSAEWILRLAEYRIRMDETELNWREYTRLFNVADERNAKE